MESTANNLPGPSLTFTDAAALKVSDLIQQEDNPALMLRVFISGGGCSGLGPDRVEQRRAVLVPAVHVQPTGGNLVQDDVPPGRLLGEKRPHLLRLQ